MTPQQWHTDRIRLYVEQFDQSATTTGGRAIRDDRYKLIRFNSGIDEFHDILTDWSEASNLLASGVAAMTATRQAHYYRLRFNLGGYTSSTTPAPLSHTHDASGFTLVVPENATATQTLWQSADLNFWSPVSGATRSTTAGSISFKAPSPLPENGFYSVLTESPREIGQPTRLTARA